MRRHDGAPLLGKVASQEVFPGVATWAQGASEPI